MFAVSRATVRATRVAVSRANRRRHVPRRPTSSGPSSRPPPPPPPLRVSLPTGAVAGSVGALCGVGGGLVIIPVLKQFSSLTVHQIAATSLFSITIASSVGAASYISQGTAHVPAAGMIAVGAVASTFFGARVAQRLNAKALTRLMAVTMLVSAPAVLLKPASARHSSKSDSGKGTSDTGTSDAGTALETRQRDTLFYLGRGSPRTVDAVPAWIASHWEYAAMGLVVGFASSLLGVGGGLVMTTAMATVTDLSQHEAVATSLVAMVPTGLSATFWHMRAGNVQTRAALAIGGACAVAMYGASMHVAPLVPEPMMRKIFAALLTVSAARMLL